MLIILILRYGGASFDDATEKPTSAVVIMEGEVYKYLKEIFSIYGRIYAPRMFGGLSHR